MKGMKLHPVKRSEEGVVSLMITLVLMIVITLIVLGFAQLSRREQRQTLDRQLSSQAFFAAESGVNDARYAIFDALRSGREVAEKDDCETSPTPASPIVNPYAFNPVLDIDNKVSYTCLLVTTKLKSIEQSIAADGKSVTVPLKPSGGNISTVHINWRLPEPPASTTGCSGGVPASGAFPKASGSGSWSCPYGVLRIDLVPLITNDLKRADLIADQRASFLYPTTAGGTQTLSYGSMRGAVASMGCTAAGGCNIDITNISHPTATNYAMRLSSVYKGGTFTITAEDAAGTDLLLMGAQAMVDATGKAQDVLRRIQVRFSLVPGGGISNGDFAIQSASSLCKRFSLTPSTNTFSIPADIQGQDQTNNPMCRPGTVNPPPPPPPPCSPVAIEETTFLGDPSSKYHMYDPNPARIAYTPTNLSSLSSIYGGCKYNITLQAADYSHPHNPPQLPDQVHEQISVSFYRGGVELARTGLTDDFPDTVQHSAVKNMGDFCFSTTPDSMTFRSYTGTTGLPGGSSVQPYRLVLTPVSNC